MRILIAGAGTIGQNLAAALVKEGQDVVVVDSDPTRLARIESSIDCQFVCADATSARALEDLGIRRTDLVVAVTRNDAVNIMICGLADFYGVQEKLARLRNPEYTDPDCPVPSEHFGIDRIFSPEGLAVDLIDRLMACPGAREAIDFERGRIAVRALVVSEASPIVARSIAQVDAQLGGRFMVGAIRRGGRMLVPGGSEVFRVGDTAYIVCRPDDVLEMARVFDPEARVATSAIIASASAMGLQVARRLSRRLKQVILIEEDADAARLAAEAVDGLGVEVLNGSALDIDLLTRCNAERADYFLALDETDEQNFLSALLFKKYGYGVPIVLTNQLHYMDLLESADLDVVINPRVLAVSALLRHIRSDKVLSAAKLHSEEIEVQEWKVTEGAAVAGVPLKKLGLHSGILLAAVLRGDEVHLPGGNFQVHVGDRVLVFNDPRGAGQVERLFR